jgi:predicted ATPase
MVRPSGTVTFLFTDIEGSTRRWENDPEAMGNALLLHDETLGSVIEAHGGWLFKHTGDGVCAAFGSARAAIDAAVAAQQTLGLPVRMGIATGEAERRGEDYFGPVLNRTARVMAAGHGGQILVASSTAAVVSGVDLIDRGEHRLRDLSGVEHLYQVRAAGLRVEFAPLRTLDGVPGNLPVQTTSFVGREVAVKEVAEQVRAHRFVTLTGVGGVGKTRLAVQVAAEVASEFPDGVWLVELAPVGDPAAVPDVIANALRVTPQAGMSMTDSLTQVLSGRRLLLVLDNCEHVLGAAGDLVETILTGTATVTVLATSREGLGLPAEQLWPVPSLDVDAGADSAAFELFIERAHSVKPDFAAGVSAETDAVAEICRRLDGIALAVELAAARMVAMSAQDVRDRLDDRFRLLAGGRRGLERHQTLRNTVQWSYDLLDDDERAVLHRCAMFAGGFDLAAVTHLCDGLDEYAVLDQLDSLVRKSLVTTEPAAGHVRYGMLETMRQFAEEQLAATGAITAVRDRHARYFAGQAFAYFAMWDGPRQRVAADWVDVEYANLRAGFRWAADHGDLDTAVALAAHTTLLGYPLLRYEAVGWAEEILDAATAADVRQLPRLYTAASLCSHIGRPHDAIGYAHTAVVLATDPRYDAFEPGISGYAEAVANIYAGQFDQALNVHAGLVGQPGLAHVAGLVGMLIDLRALGRFDEAQATAEEAVTAARAHGNPYWIAASLATSGLAFADADPARALDALRQALAVSQDHRVVHWETIVAREAAALEAVHGDLDKAFALFEAAIDSLHRSGNHGLELSVALADLAVLFDRLERPEIAATFYGAGRQHGDIGWVTDLPDVVNHCHIVLGEAGFEERVAAGAAMEFADAVAYARDQIQAARRQIADAT